MNYKGWIAVVMALLAGLLLGNWAPQADLKKALKELAELKATLSRREARSTEIGMVTTMLKVPEKPPAEPRPKSHRHRAIRQPASDTNTTTTISTVATNNASTQTNRHVSLKENIATAEQLWETRAQLARQSFISNIKATPEQTTNFVIVVEAMNLRLGTAIDKWAAILKTRDSVQPEDGVRMVNELSDIVVATYDEMDRKMPADWRQKAGEDFQLFNFIDPDVATPLVDLEGRFAPRNANHRNPAREPDTGVEGTLSVEVK